MKTLSVAVLCVLLAAPWAGASPDEALTPEVRGEVLEALCGLLEEIYVIPETADRLQEMVRGNLQDGAYDGAGTRAEFAAAVTRDLQELSHDRHLRLMEGERLGPGGGAGGPQRVVARGEPQRVVRRGPGGGSDGGVFDHIRGIPEAKMLPGNVGYVDIRLFAPREMAEQDAVNAMAAVAGADAVLFDLRACMGGSPDMVHLITSYVVPPEPMHLLTYYHGHREPDSAYTLAEVPGERLEDADVYILTSGMTASGGEEFTYNLKHHGRATVVGEKTAGAGHGGGVHPVAAGFHAFVPDFRPVHPVTGGGWEDVGVLPDVDTPSQGALNVAHRMALEAIRTRETDGRRAAELAELIATLEQEAARKPEPVDPARLAEYAGVFGYRTIHLDDDGLSLQREGGPKLLLVATGEPDAFTLERIPQAKIRFERDGSGAVEKLHVLGLSGAWEVTSRTN